MQRRLIHLAVISGAALGAGCADRRIHIASEPAGATVYLNDAEVGQTPCEVNFTYFGVYDVRLHKDGCEPLVTKARTDAPIYEWPGFDLAAMAVPGVKHTDIYWKFKLEPADTDVGTLMQRATKMRDQAEASAPAPTP